ncbi:MAG: hypothetical protein HMLKMBBP_01424 [Planctomycetes bacterium]|nr:hypothetical protein [Planctomycetota bacterium]
MKARRIRELRILPPLAIGRQGSSPRMMDNYTLEDDPADPTGFRRIVPAETLVVDDATGEIRESFVPAEIAFKDDGKFRRVAPFLEVFAVLDPAAGSQPDGDLVPLTEDLLDENGLSLADVEWSVHVANRKVARRTGDEEDTVTAKTGWFRHHDPVALDGHCPHFVKDGKVGFGSVRFIRPNERFPGLRLRFTPATGLIYGPKKPVEFDDPGQYVPPPELRVYGKGNWPGFEVPPAIDSDEFPGKPREYWNDTLPPSLFAIVPPAPPWLYGNAAKSRGFLDDTCDGIVEVRLRGKGLSAAARVTSGPPMVIPDSLFVRTLADDLDQVLFGPEVPADEPPEVTRARAEDIVRRAFETVRFLNVEVMNGNDVDGRPALLFDTMPYEEAADTQRPGRPIMSPETADTAAVLALHQQVYTALRSGAAPWFARLLRRPEEAADYTDAGRRKMPALMIGGDNNYLALTYRMIDTIGKAARAQPFEGPIDPTSSAEPKAPAAPALTPRNRSAQLHYAAAGNPVSSRIETSISNCCPGLEVDFRAVWRRMLEGLVLREYDSLVVDVESDRPALKRLHRHRLQRIGGIPTTAVMRGPNTLDPDDSATVPYEGNPHGLAPLEWSNALAHLLWKSVGKKVVCDFSAAEEWYVPTPWNEKTSISVELTVRPFFEPGTVVISRALAQPGELTQGLCSPWQNDYRECSCYYWASARPDFVNVEVTREGRSTGDNWMQIERSGKYVPDDYMDARLVDYDRLFHDWEKWLRVQLRGRDAPGEAK